MDLLGPQLKYALVLSTLQSASDDESGRFGSQEIENFDEKSFPVVTSQLAEYSSRRGGGISTQGQGRSIAELRPLLPKQTLAYNNDLAPASLKRSTATAEDQGGFYVTTKPIA